MVCNTLIGDWLPVLAIGVYGAVLYWFSLPEHRESAALCIPIATVVLGLILFNTWASGFERSLYGCHFDPGICGYTSQKLGFFFGCQ